MDVDKMNISENISEQVLIPIDKIRPSPRNPREMSATKFNYLVKNIEENGFNDPILVASGIWENGEIKNEGEIYEVIDGNHRLKAAKLLGLTHLPCLIFPRRLTPIQRDYMGVRYNSLHNSGYVNDKFTEIVNDLLKEFKDREEVINLFMQDRSEFERYYNDVRSSLPDEIKEKLPKTAEEIKTIDDLASILNRIFTEYGDTLDYNFMIFDYGGKNNLWVRCDKELWQLVSRLADDCKRDKKDINSEMKNIFLKGVKKEDA